MTGTCGLYHGGEDSPRPEQPLQCILQTSPDQNTHICEAETWHLHQWGTPLPATNGETVMFTNVIIRKEIMEKLIHFHLGIGCYQIDLKSGLKWVIQVDHEGAFAQSQRVSFCLHLPRHILVNHVGFFHHLGTGEENKNNKISQTNKQT